MTLASVKKLLLAGASSRGGQAVFTASGTWKAPPGVRSVCVVAVGRGDNGASATPSGNGAGGALAWRNAIPVVPGQSYPVTIADASSFKDAQTVWAAGGNNYSATTRWVGDGGGNGGYGPGGPADGGGGAGGYAGPGGEGGTRYTGAPNAAANGKDGQGGGGGGGGATQVGSSSRPASGGGVGLQGQGNSGAGGAGGANASGGGGGSGGTAGSQTVGGQYGGGGAATQLGGPGAVRIIWGLGRAFPSTKTGDI